MKPVTVISAWMVVLCALFGCADRATNSSLKPKPGWWTISFSTNQPDSAKIPILLEVDSAGAFVIHNNGEEILLDSLVWQADSFFIKMPLFQTFLRGRMLTEEKMSGVLFDPTRSADYKISFIAERHSIQEQNRTNLTTSRRIYDVTFSPGDSSSESKAIGVFDVGDGYMAGTFLTETGDYRFLHGDYPMLKNGDGPFHMSCFDGAHLFHFTGYFKNDSIVNGKFYSGRHWTEPWEGKINDRARLRDPDSLTYVKPESGPFTITVLDLKGNEVHFGPEDFKDHVTIVQIFGSWCPNCTDETKFFRELYAQYGGQKLQIIPVAFERPSDLKECAAIVESQWKELNMPYPAYLGVGSGKQAAEKTFPMLSRIMSFPTSIVIDKNGAVRKIHTGFYGPGTGHYYEHYTDRLELFVSQLLNE